MASISSPHGIDAIRRASAPHGSLLVNPARPTPGLGRQPPPMTDGLLVDAERPFGRSADGRADDSLAVHNEDPAAGTGGAVGLRRAPGRTMRALDRRERPRPSAAQGILMAGLCIVERPYGNRSGRRYCRVRVVPWCRWSRVLTVCLTGRPAAAGWSRPRHGRARRGGDHRPPGDPGLPTGPARCSRRSPGPG